LVYLGHEIDIVIMGYGDLARQECSGGVTVHRLRPIRRDNIVCHTSEMVRHELRTVPFALQLIKQDRYDLNHSHFVFPDGLSALAVKKLPTWRPAVARLLAIAHPGLTRRCRKTFTAP
jgi:hypothetical protein